jgi:RNA polymerase-binding protein DksA
MQSVDEFRAILEATRQKIRERLDVIKLDVRNEINPVSRDSREQSQERENDEVLDALGNTARAELARINHALARIESGDYFTCEVCGEPISEGRLRLIPHTTLCVDCAEDQELY